MEKREVYFDNSATTRAFDEVRDIVAETMTVDYRQYVLQTHERRGGGKLH